MTLFDSHRPPLLERIFAGHHDVLAALRSLRRSPGFVAIAVLSLGFAIGINTTTYAMLDAIRVPYLPYDRPDELFTVDANVYGRAPTTAGRDMVVAMLGRSDLYQTIVPWQFAGVSPIEVNGRTNYVSVVAVRRDLFRVLGVKPVVGRIFNADGGEGGNDPPAIISFKLWSEAFARNPNLERLSIAVGDVVHPVIGVMPPAMRYPHGTQVWLPLAPSAVEAAGRQPVSALIRLRPGDSRKIVQEKFDALARSLAEDPKQYKSPLVYSVNPDARTPRPLNGLHIAMAGVALLVLLVACLNLANLILARSLSRRREIAVRMAVGASGAAIVRYVLTECALLGAAGGLWGVMLSLWGIWLVQYHMPPELAGFGFIEPHMSWRILTFGAAATIATVLLAGLGPALRAQRGNVNDAMKDGGATTGKANRSYSLLVIGEVALSLVVLMSAGLLIRGAARASSMPIGYDATHMYRGAMAPSSVMCPRDDSSSTYMASVAERVARISGVRYAAVAMDRRTGVVTSDDALGLVDSTVRGYSQVTPDFFRTYGIEVTEGRDFEPSDVQMPGAAIISRALAAHLWPFESPIGRSIKLGPPEGNAPWVRVVGIVGDRTSSANEWVFGPNLNLTVVRGGACRAGRILFRTKDDSPSAPVAVYLALRAATPGGFASPLTEELRNHKADLAARTMMALTFTAFGLFALALCAGGIYGVLNYTVGQRMREFATRIALGAVGRDLRKIVLHDALVMVLAGTAIGAFFALAFGSIFGEGWLRGIASTDAFALIVAEFVIVTVSLAACLGPAIRASRADPLQIMRST